MTHDPDLLADTAQQEDDIDEYAGLPEALDREIAELEAETRGVAAGDSDFSELDEILADAEAQAATRRALAAKQKRLTSLARSRNPDHELERAQLIAAIRQLEEGVVWTTVAAVALFAAQHCEVCGSEHRFFQGWMAEQQHRRDPTARRLLAGKPIEELPERIEIHCEGKVPMCADCAEAQLAINAAARSPQ